MIKKRNSDSTGYYSLSDNVTFRRMTSEEERKLFIQYQQEGDLDARDILIENQLLFVAGEAIKIAPAWLRIDEVISAGNAALFTAAKKFNPANGARFASYLPKFIRSEIVRLCRDKAPVYIPNGRDLPAAATWADPEIFPDDAVVPNTFSKQPDEILCESDREEFLKKCIRLSLNEEDILPLERHILLQHYFEGVSYSDIARDLPPELGKKGLTRQRIGQIRNAGCLKMKAHLAKHGIKGVL